jgi:hypothetical protein
MTLRSIALALIALAAAQAAAQTPSPAPPAKSTALTPPKTKLKLVQVNPVGWPTTAYLDEGSLVDKTGPNNTRLKELWLLEVYPLDQTTDTPAWSAEWTRHVLNCTYMKDTLLQTNHIDMKGKTLSVIETPDAEPKTNYAGSTMAEMGKVLCNPRWGFDGPRLTSLDKALKDGRATSAPAALAITNVDTLEWRLVGVTDISATAWADAKAPARDKWPRIHVMVRFRTDTTIDGVNRPARMHTIALNLDCAAGKTQRGLSRYYTATGGIAGQDPISPQWEPFSTYPEAETAVKQACKTSPATGEVFSGNMTATVNWLQKKLTPQ